MQHFNILIFTLICTLFCTLSINAQENTTLPNTTIEVEKMETDVTEEAEKTTAKEKKKKQVKADSKWKNFWNKFKGDAKTKENKSVVTKVNEKKKVKKKKEKKNKKVTASNDKVVKSRVQSRKVVAKNGDVFLIQEMTINAAVEKVWAINTTAEGWKAWVCPIVETFALNIGDTIKTNYEANGRIGDATTNYITIENYVPFETLTLKSILGQSWPAFMQKDKDRFYNVINFIKLDENTTKLVSYGIGYRNTDEYYSIIDYIDFMNVQSYERMIEQLEAPQM